MEEWQIQERHPEEPAEDPFLLLVQLNASFSGNMNIMNPYIQLNLQSINVGCGTIHHTPFQAKKSKIQCHQQVACEIRLGKEASAQKLNKCWL